MINDKGTCWVIEEAQSGFSGFRYYDGLSWTCNRFKAIRFCRKEDAEAIVKHIKHRGFFNIEFRVSQKEWN